MMYHNPVLLKESVDALVSNPSGIYIDCTFGGGGHSLEILKRISSRGKLFSFDQDSDAFKNVIDDERFTLVNQNFRFLKNVMMLYGIDRVDGILVDLGVSSHHFDQQERGFSTRFNGPLDMRMNKRQSLDASFIVNEYEEDRLADLLYCYGEFRESRKLARQIVFARQSRRIETTEDLKTIFHYIPTYKSNKFFAKLFQAIRIEVNDEILCLKEMLSQALEILKTGSPLVVISYHSLEDRLVKTFLKTGTFDKEPQKDFYGRIKKYFELVFNKPIIPKTEEVEQNSRARSAKMRIGIKV